MVILSRNSRADRYKKYSLNLQIFYSVLCFPCRSRCKKNYKTYYFIENLARNKWNSIQTIFSRRAVQCGSHNTARKKSNVSFHMACLNAPIEIFVRETVHGSATIEIHIFRYPFQQNTRIKLIGLFSVVVNKRYFSLCGYTDIVRFLP